MHENRDATVGLREWAEGDLPLLERLLGDPAMTVHIGGPETPEHLRARHERYLRARDTEPGGLFAVVVGERGDSAGWVGYWETAWGGQKVWEAGWSVLPEYQGRGVASTATALMIEHAAAAGGHRFVHSFPSVDNAASNAVCRNAGFVLRGPVDVEYPPGCPMRANDWCYDLGETCGS
jgi:RimJ/RimL family protein N-acetyltransferase